MLGIEREIGQIVAMTLSGRGHEPLPGIVVMFSHIQAFMKTPADTAAQMTQFGGDFKPKTGGAQSESAAQFKMHDRALTPIYAAKVIGSLGAY
jgi:hypothetical protein